MADELKKQKKAIDKALMIDLGVNKEEFRRRIQRKFLEKRSC